MILSALVPTQRDAGPLDPHVTILIFQITRHMFMVKDCKDTCLHGVYLAKKYHIALSED